MLYDFGAVQEVPACLSDKMGQCLSVAKRDGEHCSGGGGATDVAPGTPGVMVGDGAFHVEPLEPWKNWRNCDKWDELLGCYEANNRSIILIIGKI